MSHGAGGMMTPPRMPYPRHVRYSVRHQARLDAETHAKEDFPPSWHPAVAVEERRPREARRDA
jgi:hypothetical protein